MLLTWFNPAQNDSITGYQILRGPDADSLAVIEDDTGSTSTSYTDETPPAGQTHTYAMKARNASGLSDLSNTATATVPAEEEEEVLIVARHESASNTLVSNLEQTATGAGGGIAGPSHGNHYEIATSFTTGTNTLGYHLTTVQLYMNKPVGGDTPTPQISIRGDNAGLPGETALYTLNTSTEITTSHQPITFTTSDEVTLQPNTKYWLYINATGGTVIAQETASDDEDFESNVNWQIGDDRVFKENGGTWTTATASSLRMAIHGHAAPAFLVSNLDTGTTSRQFTHQSSTNYAKFAQSFSAANNADDATAEFDFHGITVKLGGHGGFTVHITASDLVVTLNSDDSGEPGALIYTLTPPPTISATDSGTHITFTAPPGSTLSSGVTYWLKIETATDSTHFDRNYIHVFFTSDDGEVQGPATVNRWFIGDTYLRSPQALSWETAQRSLAMAVHGAQLLGPLGPLVSNLGQTSAAPIQTASDQSAAQAFVAAPGPADFGYHFQGIRVSARGYDFFGDLHIPQVRASLHGDSGGVPGARLHTLTMPLDFASTSASAEYTLLAPPGTVLRGGARYWVVFEVLINNLYLEATSSADEDPRLEAWSIDNNSYTKQASGWVGD